MEKIVDQYIRENNLANFPLHRLQFAYQQGKSTETAIHSLVTVIEKAIESKQIALCAFIDISGAFDNTSYEAIYNALYLKEVPEPITRWIIFMLKSRTISTELGGTIKSIKATRGCPQGGVLSPLLWTLVIDELLHKLNNLGFHTQGYADDLVVYVLGWHEETISDRMQQALTIINKWCTEKGLSINPSKTTLVPFTRRRNINLKCPTLNGTTLQLSTEANYLGVSLDKTLTWNSHIERVTSKATRAFFACTRLFGKTWGLNPRMTFWTFTTVVKPIVTYASLAWWPKVKQRKAVSELNKLRRLICVGITGAMKTCPTDALGVLLNIPPLPILIEREARSSALRLKGISELKSGDMKGHLKILEDFLHSPILHRDDILSPKPILFRNFQVIINERTDWRTNSITFKPGSQLWFTDGSKLENGRTGAGINGPKFKKSIPMGFYPTIFQAEIHAIEICVRECLRRKMRGTHIYILSDSQAALKALLSTTITSKLVNDCLNLLNTLGNLNIVTLGWIPGHEGHEGNEMADDLAKQGANMQLTGPEPFCGLTKGHINEFLRKWEERKLAAHWLNCAGQRQVDLTLTGTV